MNSETKWHPAASIFPMLSDEKLIELAEDIEKNGQREPILLLDGLVLDGRNRMAACRLKGCEPATKIVADIEDPVAYVLSLNLHRRHLTPSQASMCSARAREIYEQQAKERQKLDNLNRENLPDSEKGRARDAAGKAFGVSGKSVDFAKKVIDKGIPGLAKAVDEGRMAVSTAAVLASEPAEQQQAAIESQANRDYSKLRKPKAEERKPRHQGEHNVSEVFALTKADVAITQLNGIPMKNKFRNAAIDRVQSWIDSQKKGTK